LKGKCVLVLKPKLNLVGSPALEVEESSIVTVVDVRVPIYPDIPMAAKMRFSSYKLLPNLVLAIKLAVPPILEGFLTPYIVTF